MRVSSDNRSVSLASKIASKIASNATRLATAVGIGAIAGLVSLTSVSPAFGQDLNVGLSVVDGVPKEGETKAAPIVRAVVDGPPGLDTEDFVLKEEAEPPLTLAASKSVTYVDSDEKMVLVILVEGDFRWMGNETYAAESDEGDSIFPGAFVGLPPAIDALVAAGPDGSLGSLVVYNDTALIKQEMGDIKSLTGAALGKQQDYEDYVTKSFLVGLQESFKSLNAQSGRRVLVVIGNGQDLAGDAIGEQLKSQIDSFKKSKVEVYTIHYSNTDDEQTVPGQTNMSRLGYSRHYNATSRDHFASNAKNIVEFIGARYYVDFAGDTIPFDGQEHELVVAVGDDESEALALQMPTFAFPKKSEGGLWWLWVLIVLAVVLVVVVIIIIARRKPAPAQAPAPMMVDVPPPEPAGPRKTVMFNLNAGSEYPVVGWIVPLSGPNQFQTFKLLHGATKIGTGGEAHIIVDDGFMSTVHAEIVCKQSGFSLVDGGSTNGSFVNDRKISEHELVDNDMFTLGKTPFKFKSIN